MPGGNNGTEDEADKENPFGIVRLPARIKGAVR